MCRLKRCFASCALVLLLSSVFLVPCSAETWGDGIAVTASIGDRDSSTNQYYHVSLPFSGRTVLYSSDAATFTKQPLSVASAYYSPVDHDRTMFLTLGVQNNTAGYDSWFNQVDYNVKPSVFYADSRLDGSETSGLTEYPNGVTEGNDVYAVYGEAGEIFNFQVTIPAYSNSFEFSTAGFVTFTTSASPWHIVTYGGFVVDTADSSILSVVEQILQSTSDLSVNFGNLVLTVNDILAELRAIGADTAATVELLSTLTDLSDRQLTQLELIAGSVDAIYYFLTQEMKDSSEQLSEQVAGVAGEIDNLHAAEDYYQTSMQSSYNQLDMQGFTFGTITNGLTLVSQLFSDVFDSFGYYKIIFTYPLLLGVALVVIGRLSRTDRSLRNKDGGGEKSG